jgi:integrase
MIDLYLIPQLGRHKLRELNPRHVQAFLNALPKKLAGNTIRNIRALLRKALNVALGWHLVEYNAAQPVTLPKKGVRKKVQALEPSQVAAFFAALKGHPREVLYRVATIMGLREGELLALLKTDVDLENCELHISKQVQVVDGVMTVRTTKTEASQRTLTIPDMLIPDFARQLQEQPECSLLFPSGARTYILPRNLVRQFKGLLDDAGLPRVIRFHDLRHTAGSWALAHGMDIKTTQEMLGHTQASTTINTYGHPLKERRANVVNTAVNKGFGVDSIEKGEGL